MQKRERTYLTIRLWQSDRELLQQIADVRGKEDRYTALLDLVPVVEKLKLPDLRGRKRQPLRLGIPAELDAALKKVAQKTGHTYIDVLLAAAREYAKRPRA